LERLALIARLKPGTEGRAQELIAAGPPFDPEESGFARHSVFLSATEVVFVFEGHQVEWMVDDLVEGQFLHPSLADALEEWRPLIEGQPRIAREKFFWEHPSGP
jgi:hypothetical protein